MSLFRKSGQLFDDSANQSLKDRVNKLGSGTPTSPAGAAAIGATPKQQDMAGSPAQKTPVLQEAVKKEETLAGSERLEQSRQTATTAEQSAAQRAQQLRSLGSLDSRVQTLIEQKLSAVSQQPATATGLVQTDYIGQVLNLSPQQVAAQKEDPASKYNQVNNALQTYADNPTGQAAEEALVTLTNAGVTPTTARQLINTSTQATAQTVATNTSDGMTVAELDVNQLGYDDIEQLAGVLGVDSGALASMTIPELIAAVDAAKQQEFSRIQKLQAQLATAVPGSAQHTLLMRELGDLSQVGVTGSERQVAETAYDIKLADSVEIAGQILSVEEMLKDENISRIITDYLRASPAARDRMLPPEKFADLRDWIDLNQQALGELATALETTGSEFEETQRSWNNLGNVGKNFSLPPDVLSELLDWTDGRAVTSAQLAAAQEELANTSIGKLAAAGNTEILSKLTADNINQVKDLTPEEITAAHEYAELANKFPYRELLGRDGTDKFITDSTVQQSIEDYRTAVDKMTEAKVLDEWMRDEDFKKLTPAQMLTMANDPQLFTEFQRFHKTKEDIAKVKTIDDVLSVLFGKKVDRSILQNEYTKLQEYARIGAPGAAERLARFRELLDVSNDGKIDDADVAGLMEKLKASLDAADQDKILSGSSFDSLFPQIASTRDDEALSSPFIMSGSDKAFFESVKDYLADDKIDDYEYNDMSPTFRQRLIELAKKNGLDDVYNNMKQRHTTIINNANNEAIEVVKNISPFNVTDPWMGSLQFMMLETIAPIYSSQSAFLNSKTGKEAQAFLAKREGLNTAMKMLKSFAEAKGLAPEDLQAFRTLAAIEKEMNRVQGIINGITTKPAPAPAPAPAPPKPGRSGGGSSESHSQLN